MLIRSAYSANIKERRDCSTALFDAARRAGDAGRAHPRPPRLDARRGRRGARRGAAPGRRLDPQRPLPRRHPPARHHPDLAASSPTASCSASPPAAPTTPTSAARPRAGCRPTRRTPRGGGRRDPADPRRRRRRSRELAAQMRNPAPAPRRPARPAGRQPGRRAAPRRARRAPRASTRCAPGWRRSSTTPSAAPGPRSPSSPTATYEAEDVLEDDAGGDRATSRLRVAATIAGDALRLDFSRHRRPGRGQPQLPALGDQVGRLLRGAGADRPRRAALGGRLPADRGDRARRAACSTPAPRPRSPPATSRPRAASPTW